MKIDFDKVGAGRLVAQLAEENDTVRLVEPEAQRVLTPDAAQGAIDLAFADLLGRSPQLPPHLQRPPRSVE